MRIWAVLTTMACAGALGCATPEWHDAPPGMPDAIAPEVGASLVVNAPTRFSWAPAERAAHYDFHVFDRETRDITRYYRTELDAGTICTPEACAVTLPIALPYVDGHAWRVRAGNNAGKSDWTRSTFSMVNGAGVGPAGTRVPAVPEPIEPAGGTLVRDAGRDVRLDAGGRGDRVRLPPVRPAFRRRRRRGARRAGRDRLPGARALCARAHDRAARRRGSCLACARDPTVTAARRGHGSSSPSARLVERGARANAPAKRRTACGPSVPEGGHGARTSGTGDEPRQSRPRPRSRARPTV